jgi:hypothetical protein
MPPVPEPALPPLPELLPPLPALPPLLPPPVAMAPLLPPLAGSSVLPSSPQPSVRKTMQANAPLARRG